MKKLKLILITCLIIFSACTNIVGDEPVVLDSTPPEETFEIDQPLLQKYLSLARKDNVLSQIKPIKESGKTLAYYVEYKEGGWELIAADKRFAPSLMKSSEGKIDEFAIFDGAIAQIKNCDINEPNAIWEALSPKQHQKHEGVLSKRGDGTGMWIPVDTFVTQEYEMHPHMITTNWHQYSPWNKACPWLSTPGGTQQCVVGCIPVAVAQITYFYRRWNHHNVEIPGSVDAPTAIGDVPSFSNFSSINWSFLEPTDASPSTSRTEAFLAYVGDQVDAIYTYSVNRYGYTMETKASDSSAKNVLRNYYKLNFDESDSYDYHAIMQSFANGSPIYVSARNSNDSINAPGHTFLIDRFTKDIENICVRYVWDPDYHVLADDTWNNPSWMFQMPDDFKDPSETYEKTEIVASRYNVYFGMNWNYNNNSNYNNILYLAYNSPYPSFDDNGVSYGMETINQPNWYCYFNSKIYNQVKKMLYNFRNQ